MQISSEASAELAEMMSVISEVEENFNKIREAENTFSLSLRKVR